MLILSPSARQARTAVLHLVSWSPDSSRAIADWLAPHALARSVWVHLRSLRLFSAHSVVRAIFVLQSALVAMKRSGCRWRIVLCGGFSWSCDSSGGCAAGGGCVRGAAGVGGCGRPALSDPVGGRLHAWSGAARDGRESLDA